MRNHPGVLWTSGQPRRDELRVAAVLLAALLCVHQLRYALAFGGDAGSALAEHGHGYLSWLTPTVAALGALAFARLLIRAATGTAAPRRPTMRLARAWPAAAAALLTLYVSQELLEGLLADGHPAWWAGVARNGGWIAAPLAAVLGLLVSLAVRASEALEARIRRCCAGVRAPLATHVVPVSSPLCMLGVPRAGVLAHHLAGRAPPAVSV